MGHGRNGGVTPEQFVRAWEGSASPSEAAEKCRLRSGAYASMRASRYRGMGVKLKKFGARGKVPVEVDVLNKIVSKGRKSS